MTQVSDPGLGSSVAIPYEAMGTNVRNAISAVETNEDDPGVMKDSYNNLFRRDFSGKRTLSASIYIARSLCYPTTKPLNQNLVELRTALQLERSYSRKQLFTIFANRVYFGPNLIGVHDASGSYFGKEPSSLSIEEGALLITCYIRQRCTHLLNTLIGHFNGEIRSSIRWPRTAALRPLRRKLPRRLP